MIDFHSHVLPLIDDGAADVETAVKMLELSKSQGVETIIATPHFYSKKTNIKEFLEKRSKSYELVKNCVEEYKVDVPEIKLGAEVHFSHEILKMDLSELCIEGTNTLLIEMPFSYWNRWVFDDLFELSVRNRVDVVMAHIERYIGSPKYMGQIEELYDMNFYMQVNADSVLERRMRKVIDHLFKKYRVDLIGTDMHNLDTRKSRIDEATEIIKKRYGKDILEDIHNNSKKLVYQDGKKYDTKNK